MNSASIVDALTDTGDMRFKIPVHTPDMNCTDNVFHTMHKEIQQNVVEQGVLKETCLDNVYYMDRVIDNMWKRTDLVVK